MSLLILASAYTDDFGRWAALRDSAAKHGALLHVMGQGQPHPGWMQSIQLAIEFLKQREEQYVVLTDSFDVVMSRWDAREVCLLIDSAPDLIMSVEWWVWPRGPWAQAYAHLEGRHHWFAINGGQYCGRREQMIAMWEAMVWRWQHGQETAGGGSQELLHKMYQDGAAFTLDLECRIFQTMFGPHRDLIKERDGKAFNIITGSYPMFLHFNGGAPGLKEWKETLWKGSPVASASGATTPEESAPGA
jgi:hypothetical protein